MVAPAGLGRPARDTWEQLLEIKTVFFSGSDFGEGIDEIPDRHLVQVQWQLEVVGLEEATLVALVNGDYREYPVHRDREMGALLLAEVGRFWHENVLARVPPPVNGSDAYTAFLRRRHPRDTIPAIPETPELREIVDRLRAAKEALKQAEAFEAEAANELRAIVGDAAGVEGLCKYPREQGFREDPGGDGRLARRHARQGHASRPHRRPGASAFDEILSEFTTTEPGARVLQALEEEVAHGPEHRPPGPASRPARPRRSLHLRNRIRRPRRPGEGAVEARFTIANYRPRDIDAVRERLMRECARRPSPQSP